MKSQNSDKVNEKSEMPTTDELTKVLEDVSLGYLLSRFSLDSTHEWSSVLSLGEQQRLAFARLLLSMPQLALLDEATSALDEANEVFINSKFIRHIYYTMQVLILQSWTIIIHAKDSVPEFVLKL